jgi:hypothetical protein
MVDDRISGITTEEVGRFIPKVPSELTYRDPRPATFRIRSIRVIRGSIDLRPSR